MDNSGPPKCGESTSPKGKYKYERPAVTPLAVEGVAFGTCNLGGNFQGSCQSGSNVYGKCNTGISASRCAVGRGEH